MNSPSVVIPAKAGIQVFFTNKWVWIPAFAGMTERRQYRRNFCLYKGVILQ